MTVITREAAVVGSKCLRETLAPIDWIHLEDIRRQKNWKTHGHLLVLLELPAIVNFSAKRLHCHYPLQAKRYPPLVS